MVEAQSFKRGCDLVTEVGASAQSKVNCVGCGEGEAGESIAELGWQVEPPVCPDCLRWTAVGAVATDGSQDQLRVERCGRFWAVLDRGALVCLTVYRKGAMEVVRRLRDGRGARYGR